MRGQRRTRFVTGSAEKRLTAVALPHSVGGAALIASLQQCKAERECHRHVCGGALTNACFLTARAYLDSASRALLRCTLRMPNSASNTPPSSTPNTPTTSAATHQQTRSSGGTARAAYAPTPSSTGELETADFDGSGQSAAPNVQLAGAHTPLASPALLPSRQPTPAHQPQSVLLRAQVLHCVNVLQQTWRCVNGHRSSAVALE